MKIIIDAQVIIEKNGAWNKSGLENGINQE